MGAGVALASAAACTTTTVLETEPPGDGGGAEDGDTRRDVDEAGPVPAPPDGGASNSAPGTDAARDGAADAPRDAPPVECGVQGQVFTSPLGPFCPFQAGNVFNNCAVGEHCCAYAEESGTASTCSAGATACDVAIATGFDWRCDERNDCPGGQVCCFAGTIAPHLQCAGQYSTSPNVHATGCRVAACAAGETQTCGSQADCPAGTTCTGMRLRGKHFGFCRP